MPPESVSSKSDSKENTVIKSDGRDFLRVIEPGAITRWQAFDLIKAGVRGYDTTGSMGKLMASTVDGQPAHEVARTMLASARGGV